MHRSIKNLGTALVAALSVNACSTDRGPTVAKPAGTLPQTILPLEPPYFNGDASLRQRLAAAELRYSWVSQLHSEAVREASATRMNWPTRLRTDRARICELAFTLGLKYAVKVNDAAGKRRGTDDENWALLRPGAQGTRCAAHTATFRSPRAMSIFAPTAPTPPAAALPTQATPAVQPWLDQVRVAYEGAGSSGHDILVAVSNVVTGAAAALSELELAEVVAGADLLLSSTAEWQIINDSGGLPGGGETGGQDPMSVFKPQVYHSIGFVIWFSGLQISEKVQAIAMRDFMGCLTGYRNGGVYGCVAYAAMNSIAAM